MIFDPTVRKTLRSADLHGSDYSAWDGWEIHGWPSLVMLRGRIAVEDGQLKVNPGDGQPIPRKLAVSIQNGVAI